MSGLTQVPHLRTSASISARSTMVVCPADNPAKKRARVVVGDDRGELTAVKIKAGGMKSGNPALDWRRTCEDEITSVAINAKKQVFAASSNRIVGYTRKGKECFTMGTTLVGESVSTIAVGADSKVLHVGYERNYQRYRDGKEGGFGGRLGNGEEREGRAKQREQSMVQYRRTNPHPPAEAEYACDGEAVNCVAAASIFSTKGNDAVLGCDDMTIRVM